MSKMTTDSIEIQMAPDGIIKLLLMSLRKVSQAFVVGRMRKRESYLIT